MIQYDYVYDLTNHPYHSAFLDECSGVLRQPVTISDGVRELRTACVRLSKYGDPGPVELSIHRPGQAVPLAQGMIPADAVAPVFERMVGIDFAPVLVSPGETLWLCLRVSQGKAPLDAYRVYGPNTRADLVNEGNARFPYWWYLNPDIRLDDVHATLPIQYRGAAYPPYRGGERLDESGQPTWSISFQLHTDQDPTEDGQREDVFAFALPLTAEPFTEWVSLRDPQHGLQVGEVLLTADWRVYPSEATLADAGSAVLEILTFLEKVMDLHLECGPADGAVPSHGALVMRLDPSMAVENAEAFTVDIRSNMVTLSAMDTRGLLRAVFWLEEEMLLRRAPALEIGRFDVAPKYVVRMVPGIYPAPSYFLLREAQIWTRGYLWRLARAGYNAVYFQASIEDFVENSSVFPEMNDPEAPQAIERLRRAVTLAAEYGIDFYWDLKTGYEKEFPESVYTRLPHLRSFRKFGNFPCTGQPETLAFLRETVSNVFRQVEQLKGLVLVYDTEGFYSCLTHNAKDRCPYCKDYPVEDLGNRIFATLKESARVLHPNRDLVLWTYICDEPWNYNLIRAMPQDVILMACYSQLQELQRFNARLLTDDYSLCSDAPSDYFLRIQALAIEKGMRFFCKTEDTFGQEFVSTPYTPCLEQHQRRWDRLSQEHTEGVITQYLHLGFLPTPCQDLMRQNAFQVKKNGQPLRRTPREKLLRAAQMNYGVEAAAAVIRAWDTFSTAIREFFPYTWGVCRYPGPLQSAPGQPFSINPDQPLPRPWARGYVNDLAWTGIRERFLLQGPWDDQVVERCFHEVKRCYAEGNRWMNYAITICAPAYRAALEKARSVSRMQQSQVETILNLIAFLRLRDEYTHRSDGPALRRLIRVLERERANTETALWLVEHNSLLGFSCEGDGNVRGGHFTAATVAAKRDGLSKTLDLLYQALEEGPRKEGSAP
jgi:hypothetical protein